MPTMYCRVTTMILRFQLFWAITNRTSDLRIMATGSDNSFLRPVSSTTENPFLQQPTVHRESPVAEHSNPFLQANAPTSSATENPFLQQLTANRESPVADHNNPFLEANAPATENPFLPAVIRKALAPVHNIFLQPPIFTRKATASNILSNPSPANFFYQATEDSFGRPPTSCSGGKRKRVLYEEDEPPKRNLRRKLNDSSIFVCV